MNLKLVGHSTHQVNNGNEIMKNIQSDRPGLILLDILLPGKNGFELMKEIAPLHIPVIFLQHQAVIKNGQYQLLARPSPLPEDDLGCYVVHINSRSGDITKLSTAADAVG